MTTSALLPESIRTGYNTMSEADHQLNRLGSIDTWESIDHENLDFLKFFNPDELSWEGDLPDCSSANLFSPFTLDPCLSSLAAHGLSTTLPELFTLDNYMTHPLCNASISSIHPPPSPSMLIPPIKEDHEESTYRNMIPTVVQDSLSEDDGEEEDDDNTMIKTGCRKLNSSTHSNKYDKIPRTIFSSATTVTNTPRRVRRRKDQLWYFLLETLGNPKYNPNYIQWENKDLGIFRFIESKKVAQLWGAKKNRNNMSYEYFARAMRHYYSRGIMRRVAGRRLVYQFGPKAENWKSYAQLVTVSNSSSNNNNCDISSSDSSHSRC